MTTSETQHALCETCDATDLANGIAMIIRPRARPVGSGVVARLLPAMERRMIGPFVFFDHMGPVTFAPGEGFDVRPHPHIGLSTVSYLFEGEILHRDSLRNVQVIAPGDMNLMTAGRGIVHSERSPRRARIDGGVMHGLQLWVALRDEDEEGEPSFLHAASADFPVVSHEGVDTTVLLGTHAGRHAPVVHPSKPHLVDARLAAGATFDVQGEDGETEERAVYVVEGSVQVGQRSFGSREMIVLAQGKSARLTATTASRVIVIGGPNLGPRFIEWNFVSSSKERIEKAKDAWRARAFPIIPGDDLDFIPLP